MENKELLKNLIAWLELKKMDLTEQDIKYFEDIIRLASNNGYRKAAGIKII